MLPINTFKGKNILITGGGTGLGFSMAKYFASLGANLVLTSRRQEVLDHAAQEIKETHAVEVLPIACDVRDMKSVESTLTTAYEELGIIHALVNNAAGNFISPTERLSHRAFESVIGIVLQGTANWSLAMGKRWISDGTRGVMLNIVVSYAWTGSGYTVPSACAKAGVLALTRSLATEWGRKYGIRQVAIAPGPFPTKGAWDRLFPDSARRLVDPIANNPMQRVGEHIELAHLAGYLLSDYAAYINGEVVTIDGGEWLQGAGMFNGFHQIPDEMWDQLEAEIRKAKNTP